MSSDPTRDAIKIEALTVRFGEVTAVNSLNLAIPVGEVFGFVGPNGAGKSTTIRSLLDLQRPTSGAVTVLGEAVRSGGPTLRARCGYLPGDLALFPYLTGAATMDFFARRITGFCPVIAPISFMAASRSLMLAAASPTPTFTTTLSIFGAAQTLVMERSFISCGRIVS